MEEKGRLIDMGQMLGYIYFAMGIPVGMLIAELIWMFRFVRMNEKYASMISREEGENDDSEDVL